MRTGNFLHGHFLAAWRAISTTRLRTMLAILGVTIGVAAIVLVFALGAAAQTEVLKSVNALGSNMVMVFPVPDASQQRGATERRRRLTEADARLIGTATADVRAVAPQLRLQVRLTTAASDANATLIGVEEGYFDITQPVLEDGQRIGPQDAHSRVVMLGSSLAKRLFGDESAVGRLVRVHRIEFTVVGVFQSSGGSALGDRENFVLAPISVVRQRLAKTVAGDPDAVDLVFVQYHPTTPLADARAQVVELLRRRYRVGETEIDPFTVETTEEFAKHSESIVDVLRLTLTAVASISLLVGGIGIMNIMLVSVTERTREIGIRLAVGARPRDIRNQFLVESAVICSLGGLVGAVLALGVAALGSVLSGWQIVVSPPVLALALVFSAGIGVLAGYLPAARASKLDPIEALRRD